MNITKSILESEKKLMNNITVPSSLIDREDTDFGLNKNSLLNIANITSFIHENTLTYSNRSSEDAKNISDIIHTIARAMVKDTLPGEESVNTVTSVFNIQSQKINMNNTQGLSKNCPAAGFSVNSAKPISAPGLNESEHTLVFGQIKPDLFPTKNASSIKTEIIRFSFFNTSGKESEIKELVNPINLTFTNVSMKPNAKPSCSSYDYNTSSYVSRNLSVVKLEKNLTTNLWNITCSVTHLSDFAIIDGTDDSTEEWNLIFTDAALWIMYSIIGLLILLLIWSIYVDSQDRKHEKRVENLETTDVQNSQINDGSVPVAQTPVSLLDCIFVLLYIRNDLYIESSYDF